MAEASTVLTDEEDLLCNGLPPVPVEPKIPLGWQSHNVIAPCCDYLFEARAVSNHG